jgi:hypothetical protein
MFKMIEKLGELARQAAERDFPDPSVFNDPVAMRTEWTPKANGGSNFTTHRMRKVHDQRMEFRATGGMRAFALLFLLVGLGVMAIAVPPIMRGEAVFSEEILFPLLFGAVFALVGGLMIWFALTPIIFDLGHGYYWRNRKRPDRVIDPAKLKNCVPLARIHALQILSERVSSSNSKGRSSTYFSYELNLVLDDGSRLNVVDHGNIDHLRRDAGELAALLKKPVWDATLAGNAPMA